MESRDISILIVGIIFTILGVVISFVLPFDDERRTQTINIDTHQCEQLRIENDSLRNEIKILEEGFNSKEQRYEDIIWEFSHKPSKLKRMQKMSKW